MSAPRASSAFAPNAWLAICTTENANTAAVSAASSASWREPGADLVMDTRRSLVSRRLPGHLPRQEACHPAGGGRGSVERTFRADHGRPSFAVMQTKPISPQPVDRTGRWLASLTQWVLAHKRLVAVGWLALTLVGFYGAAKVTDALNENFTMPDSASTVTNERIASRFDS